MLSAGIKVNVNVTLRLQKVVEADFWRDRIVYGEVLMQQLIIIVESHIVLSVYDTA